MSEGLYELADLIATGDDSAVEAVYQRLIAQHGHDRGTTLWTQACNEADHSAATDAAVEELGTALTEAGERLRSAQRALERLTDGEAWHNEYAEGEDGRDLAADLEAAARFVRGAARTHAQLSGSGS